VVFDHMRKKGIPVQPAQSNVPDVRIQAIVHALDKMIDGQPYVLIDRQCVQLRKALAGGWHYKRMNLLNEDRYHETPNKNHPDSDIGDALGYLFLGAGEVQDLRRAGHVTSRTQAPVVMATDFDVFRS